MKQALTLFVGMFTTLLAIINPLEALPVFLKLLEGRDEQEHRRVARVGIFVSSIGMGLIFHGVIGALQLYGVVAQH